MAPPSPHQNASASAVATKRKMQKLLRQHNAANEKRAMDADESDEEGSDDSDTAKEIDQEADIHEEDIDVDMYKDVDMGYELEPFNMKSERENGRFLENGRYIPNKAKDDEGFLDGPIYIPKKFVSKYAKKKGDDSDDSDDTPDEVMLWETVVNHLKPGETVTEAIARLGGKQAKGKNKGKQGTAKKKNELHFDKSSSASGAQAGADPKAMDSLLAAANTLMMQFACNQIFQFERERASRFLQKLLLKRDITRDRQSVFLQPDGKTPNDRKWEYKPLATGATGGSTSQGVQGPFSSADMLKWRAQGYFVGQYCSNVREVKACDAPGAAAGGASSAGSAAADLMNDLMDSDDDEEDDDDGKAGGQSSSSGSKTSGAAAPQGGVWTRSDEMAWPSDSFFLRSGLVPPSSAQ